MTGNTAVDALLHAQRKRPRRAALPARVIRNRRLILVTAHRRESWGKGIHQICLALRDLAAAFEEVVIAYAVHPNPLVRATAEKVLAGQERVHLIDPPDYVAFVDLMRRAYLIITDSGGIQEEAPSLALPVLVTRYTTERVEGIAAGGAELVGPDRSRIVARASLLLDDPAAYADMARVRNPYGDGKAAARIRRALSYHFRLSRRRPTDFKVTECGHD